MNVRARLYAYPDPPSLPQQQRELADEIVELIKGRRLSVRQAGQLERAFFVGREGHDRAPTAAGKSPDPCAE
jgi:hypothetical protein